MSFYTIATASLTTPADRRRRPALDKGQMIRALSLCAIAFLAPALAITVRRSCAAESGFPGFASWPMAQR